MIKKLFLIIVLTLAIQTLCPSLPAVGNIPGHLKKYSFIPRKYHVDHAPGLYGGYSRIDIVDDAQYDYPDFKIKSVTYYVDEILIKKIEEKDAAILPGNFKSYEFRLANPDKRTKLQPVKHKWVIDSTHGELVEEKTLYVFGKEFGHYTFTDGIEKGQEDFKKRYGDFRFREAQNKQPPVVSTAGTGGYGPKGELLDAWQVNAVDNGRVTKVEYLIDGKLIQTYTGDLPHRFEIINTEKKPVGSKLDVLFNVYDDDGNITPVPKGASVKKNTRTELHDEEWMYTKFRDKDDFQF